MSFIVNPYVLLSTFFPVRYFKFDPVTNGGDLYVQLSEFLLLNNGAVVTGGTYSNLSGTSPANEQPPMAGDQNLTTKWLTFNGINGGLLITYPSPVTINGYRMATANDVVGRDPSSWVLYASKDNLNWVPISTKTYTMTSSRNTYVPDFSLDL